VGRKLELVRGGLCNYWVGVDQDYWGNWTLVNSYILFLLARIFHQRVLGRFWDLLGLGLKEAFLEEGAFF